MPNIFQISQMRSRRYVSNEGFSHTRVLYSSHTPSGLLGLLVVGGVLIPVSFIPLWAHNPQEIGTLYQLATTGLVNDRSSRRCISS